MPDATWKFDASSGRLIIRTGVTGRAARMGHRLTIAMTSWRAEVTWTDEQPRTVELIVDVASLEVLRGEGGVTPLTGPEKALARANALKTLGADRFRTIDFRADEIAQRDGGYRLTGTLQIRGTSRPCDIDLRVQDVGDTWGMSCEAQVRQSEFGVQPYSMFMGSMKVTDEVTVSFVASRSKER
ncbi:MAG: YceI family protein [Mycobacteriaceae bacterium]|nr:YceI family protein [Mycobacteriaceae bacterium]